MGIQGKTGGMTREMENVKSSKKKRGTTKACQGERPASSKNRSIKRHAAKAEVEGEVAEAERRGRAVEIPDRCKQDKASSSRI